MPLLPLVTRLGNRLAVEGRPWRGIGCNCYYLAIDNTSRGVVDEIVGKAAEMGLNVIRTWAFHDGPGKPTALQTAPGCYLEERLEMLDYALDRMAAHGIRAVLALANYWDDYGGMRQWVDWFGGGNRDDFYTRPEVASAFRAYVRYLVNRVNTCNGRRYGGDGAVLAWQLANEPRSKSGSSILTRWIDDTAGVLKRDFSVRQLVTTGMEGFYGEGTHFIEQHESEAIDVAGFHVYPDHWRMGRDKVRRWVRDHVRDAKRVLGKPVMLDEYGLMVPPNTIEDRDQHFRDVLEICEEGGADVTCFWMLYEDGHPDFDRFGVYYPRDASTVAVIREYAARVRRTTNDEGPNDESMTKAE